MRPRPFLVPAFLAVAGLLAACGNPAGPENASGRGAAPVTPDTRSPAEPSAGDEGYLPLDIGTRWTYARTLDLELRFDGGLSSFAASRARIDQEMIGVELIDGREYAVQEERSSEDGRPELPPLWWRYRQDDTGLYQADVAANVPPVLGRGRTAAPDVTRATDRVPGLPAAMRDAMAARLAGDPRRDAVRAAWDRLAAKLAIVEMARTAAAGIVADGPEEGEITRLAYPLRPGARWTIRSEPFLVEAEVEAAERVRTPAGVEPAWRIRIENDVLTEEDRAVVWWGRRGVVATWARLGGIATDENGNEIGRIVAKQRDVLREFRAAD